MGDPTFLGRCRCPAHILLYPNKNMWPFRISILKHKYNTPRQDGHPVRYVQHDLYNKTGQRSYPHTCFLSSSSTNLSAWSAYVLRYVRTSAGVGHPGGPENQQDGQGGLAENTTLCQFMNLLSLVLFGKFHRPRGHDVHSNIHSFTKRFYDSRVLRCVDGMHTYADVQCTVPQTCIGIFLAAEKLNPEQIKLYKDQPFVSAVIV